MIDVIVIGGGPAGISAGIYLKRFKYEVLVIMKDFGSLEKTDHIENYYGFPEPVSGRQIVENGLSQAKRLGIPIKNEEVLNIDKNDFFTVKTAQNEYLAKAVLLATGINRPNLRIPGFSDFVGKGISYCAVCDGFLYRKKTIAVMGDGDFMAEELSVLRNFTNNLLVFTNGVPLRAEIQDVKIITDPILRFSGNEVLSNIETKNQKYDVNAVFVAIGTPSAADFALRMGAFIEANLIVVDDTFMTNIPGLFAAGDCIGGLSQIAKAVADGAQASIFVNKYLRTKTS